MLEIAKKGILIVIAGIIFILFFMLIEIDIFTIIFMLSFLLVILHANSIGAYVFGLLSLLVNVLIIRHVRSNIQKRTWKEQLAEKTTYRLRGISKNNPKLNVIEFDLDYKIFRRLKTKTFRINIKNDKMDIAIKKLKEKIGTGKLYAVIYSNPRNEGKITFQNEFTVMNYILAPIVVSTQIGLYLYTVYYAYINYHNIPYEIGGFTNWSENSLLLANKLNTSPSFYLILLNIVLIIIYLTILALAAMKYKIGNLRKYPLFKEEGTEVKRNFISELVRMNELCTTCGEIVEMKEDYCSNCGSMVVQKF